MARSLGLMVDLPFNDIQLCSNNGEEESFCVFP